MAYNADNPTISGIKERKVRLANKLAAREFSLQENIPHDQVPVSYDGEVHTHTLSGAFRLNHAMALMECCALAYVETPQEIEKIATQWGFDHVRTIDRQNARALLLENDDSMVIAFRGCDTRMDLLRSMKGSFATRVFSILAHDNETEEFPYSINKGDFHHYNEEMPVHGGAAKYLDATNDEGKTLWQSVDQARKAYLSKHPHGKVYITGHSLGGSIALLGVSRVIAEHDEKSLAPLYTFGQPRVGNQEFADYIDEKLPDKYFRIVNNGDWFTGYPGIKLAHAGTEVRISPLGSMSINGEKVMEKSVCLLPQNGIANNLNTHYHIQTRVFKTNSQHHTPLAYLYNLDFATRTRDLDDIPQTLIGKRELAQRFVEPVEYAHKSR